jgi:uncharacterized protein (DUF488 family)
MKKLYQIGYEGSDVFRLTETLQNIGVEVLADVRQLPLSRKKGLSKNGLAEHLACAGIDYIHFRELGDPKAGREAARAGEYAKFEMIFLKHLAQDPAQEALNELLTIASSRITCMLCFERCAQVCHRSYISDQAAMDGFAIYSLVPDRPESYLQDEFEIPRYHPRQSLSAAE